MKLSRTDSVSIGDLAVIWKQTDCDFFGVPISKLVEFLNTNLTIPSASFTTQYAAPSSTGFDVAINNIGSNVHLILTPTAGFTDGEITLPPVTDCIDKQEVLVNCTQQITTLVIDGNGATAVTGEPGSMGADDFFRLKFDKLTSTWYRVG